MDPVRPYNSPPPELSDQPKMKRLEDFEASGDIPIKLEEEIEIDLPGVGESTLQTEWDPLGPDYDPLQIKKELKEESKTCVEKLEDQKCRELKMLFGYQADLLSASTDCHSKISNMETELDMEKSYRAEERSSQKTTEMKSETIFNEATSLSVPTILEVGAINTKINMEPVIMSPIKPNDGSHISIAHESKFTTVMAGLEKALEQTTTKAEDINIHFKDFGAALKSEPESQKLEKERLVSGPMVLPPTSIRSTYTSSQEEIMNLGHINRNEDSTVKSELKLDSTRNKLVYYVYVPQTSFTTRTREREQHLNADSNTVQWPTTASHLQTHSRAATDGVPFACYLCDYSAIDETQFAIHLRIHAGEKQFACHQCDYRAHDMDSLKVHLNTHTKRFARNKEKRFACNKCSYRASKRSRLKRHLKTHIQEKPFACNHCDYRSGVKANLERHLNIHNEEKPFACHQCDYRSTTKIYLGRHLKTHTGEKPFACSQCGYRASAKWLLIPHLRTHTGEKPFACSQCEYRSSTKAVLKYHLMTHSGEKPIACNQCEYRARNRKALKLHFLNLHSEEKRFSCNQCNYSVNVKPHLTRHLRDKHGEKPFACNLCDHRAAEKLNLSDHILRTHTGEKPFACSSQCDYSTNRKKRLANHLETHNGETAFACNQCEYRTSVKSSLTQHLRTHTGRKKFACNQCEYRASGMKSLGIHMWSHTAEKPLARNQRDFRLNTRD